MPLPEEVVLEVCGMQLLGQKGKLQRRKVCIGGSLFPSDMYKIATSDETSAGRAAPHVCVVAIEQHAFLE
jgi:hypothetical protein